MEIPRLQKIINESQRIHEESWDKDHYTKTLEQASREACYNDNAREWSQLVYLLNVACWNDAQSIAVEN